MSAGIEEGLRALIQDGRAWVHLGTVDKIEQHPDWGYLLTVSLRPSGRQIQTRWLQSFIGNLTGLCLPLAKGDEVLVLLPEGDQNQGVAIGGLASRAARLPLGFGNDHPELVHANGLKVRTADNAPTTKLVTADLLTDLATALTELAAGLNGLSVPTPQTNAFVAQLVVLYRSASLETD